MSLVEFAMKETGPVLVVNSITSGISVCGRKILLQPEIQSGEPICMFIYGDKEGESEVLEPINIREILNRPPLSLEPELSAALQNGTPIEALELAKILVQTLARIQVYGYNREKARISVTYQNGIENVFEVQNPNRLRLHLYPR